MTCRQALYVWNSWFFPHSNGSTMSFLFRSFLIPSRSLPLSYPLPSLSLFVGEHLLSFLNCDLLMETIKTINVHCRRTCVFTFHFTVQLSFSLFINAKKLCAVVLRKWIEKREFVCANQNKGIVIEIEWIKCERGTPFSVLASVYNALRVNLFRWIFQNRVSSIFL